MATSGLAAILTRATMARPVTAAKIGCPTKLRKTDPRHIVEVANWRILREVRDQWKDLAARAAEPNVFYDPDFALPAVVGLGLVEHIRAVLVWRSAPPVERPCLRRLIGVFPYVERRRWGLPLVAAEAFVHPFAMSSAPLVDPTFAEDAFGVLFDWLEAGGRYTPDAWLFRYLPQDGAGMAAMAAAAGRRGIAAESFDPHERAVLDTAGLGPAALDVAVSAKARKEYRRLRRRLGEQGRLEHTRATAPADLAACLEEFLALEAAGWKGRGGTAAAQSPAIAAMFRDIAAALGPGGQCEIDALRLDGRPLAMTITLIQGGTRWLWKIAYDEDYAPYSPGVLLTLDLTGQALAADQAVRWDSCALPGHPMIDRIWRQRRPYADALVVPARHSPLVVNAMTGLEALLRGTVRRLKQARDIAGR